MKAVIKKNTLIAILPSQFIDFQEDDDRLFDSADQIIDVEDMIELKEILLKKSISEGTFDFNF